jgi:hypothetical protein
MKAAKAEITGTIDVKIFARATPNSFMELIKRMKARLEHNTERKSRGFKIPKFNIDKLKPGKSRKAKKGRK